MIIFWIVLICIAALVVLFLFCIKPNTSRVPQMDPFQDWYFAHRGFFDNESDAPENSLEAFRRAIDAGYGIELDVQMSADEQLFVFHDDSLKRMCGVDRPPIECSFAELTTFSLADSEAKIPLFSDVLAAIDGQVPLIVEIKSEGDWERTSELTAQMLDSYQGLYCVESFHPLVLRWFRRNRPEVLRGQLSTNYFRTFRGKLPVSKFRAFLLSNLLLNFLSRPDFIAYNYRWADQWGYRLCRRMFGVVNAAWTIRSEEAMQRAQRFFDIFIFDSFQP